MTKYLLSFGERGKKEFVIDLKDDVVRGSIVLQDGEMMWPPPAIEMPPPPPSKPSGPVVKPPEQSPFSAAAWETGLTTGSNLGIIIRFWETAHLPLPYANSNTSRLGQNVGVGEGLVCSFPENYNGSNLVF